MMSAQHPQNPKQHNTAMVPSVPKALRGKALWLSWLVPALLFTAGSSLLPNQVDTGRLIASVSDFKNWGLKNDISDSHIHVADAWRMAQGSRDVVVAVIDTGIDPDHPDLKANLWHDKKTGEYGWDFVTSQKNPKDEHGHGTHVAGIIGAELNKKAGISGVAHKVSIMAVRYYSEKSSGAENLKNSIRALHYAIDHGAHIINYSGGGAEFSMEEYTALRRAREEGILVVTAAGNERSDGDKSEHYYYPCAYKLDNIVCVAATNIRNDLLASSNWGKATVDIAAPGEKILSTSPGGKYTYMSGTSQATAFVTGVAALMKSKNQDLTPQQIKDLIRRSADAVDKLVDKVASAGKLNAAKALSLLDRRTPPRGLAESVAPKTKGNANRDRFGEL
jgi:subtilisin family serine protease